jgi:hypothetical protein
MEGFGRGALVGIFMMAKMVGSCLPNDMAILSKTLPSKLDPTHAADATVKN